VTVKYITFQGFQEQKTLLNYSYNMMNLRRF